MPVLRLIALIALFSVAIASPSATTVVSPHGYLGAQIGMTVSEANESSDLNLSAGHELDEDEIYCHFVSPNGAESLFYFMVIEGRIVRIDIDTPEIVTSAGVGIGSSEAAVMEAYPGEVKSRPHPYTAGHYLTVDVEDGYAFIFETDGSKVESFRAGAYPSIRWIEGCS